MSYFEDVYLKRMNVDGRTQQERIKTRKEKEFEKLFLKKSEYQCLLYGVNQEDRNDVCSLQPSKWGESELISNLLLSTKTKQLKTGDILNIHFQIKDEKKIGLWLVLFVEENITKGYQLYKVICLDEEVNITDEYGDTKFTVPVKFIHQTGNVQDLLNTNISSTGYLGYREPENVRRIVTRDFDFLNKDVTFKYKNKDWKISGKDNISIDDVAYITIEEKLKAEYEPKSSEDILVGEDDNFFLNGR